MEVVAGRAGGQPVTAERRPRVVLHIVLYVVALVLALACVVGGVLVYQAHGDRARAAEEQERYGDVLASARAEAEALINVRYDDAQDSIDKVAAGATGKFRKQYDSRAKDVIRVLKQAKSVMTGQVVWAGIVSADEDSATVLAATSGTVANTRTHDKPVARYFRLKLDLAKVGDRWLTSDLEFVPSS